MTAWFRLTRISPIDTNIVASVVDSPYSITVTNWPEGNYSLTMGVVVPFRGNIAIASQSRYITVVPLLIQQPQQTAAGGFSFRAAGRVAGQATAIEASTNLATWQPIATNITSTNSFLFTDLRATNFSRRFYRASFKE